MEVQVREEELDSLKIAFSRKSMAKQKKTILIILGSGGHTAQMAKLVDLLGTKYDYEYIVQREDHLSEKKIRKTGRIFRINRPRKFGEFFIITTFRAARSFLQSIAAIRKSKSEAIISAGPGIGVIVSLAGKLFGRKIIFLESWSRVYNRSLSGMLTYLFADQFFVQWPELKEKYPKAIYAGRLM